MSHHYLPHTEGEISAMLEACGMKKLDELFADVPEQLMLKRPYDLPEGMTEAQVTDFFENLGAENRPARVILAGAGFYDHHVPAAIPALVSRSEFSTAYTPYQPEISQGTLQYIFEYQSMMAELTGLDVSNASMYDSATATAEAMLMMVAAGRKKNRVLVSATVNPAVRRVVDTYARYHGVEIETIRMTEDGTTDTAHLEELLAQGGVAGVIVAQPNFYGIVEDYAGFADRIHAAKALMAVNAPASTLAVLKPAGQWGADIACGDAQSLGVPLSYGGPYLGYMTCTNALMRKMPGRIVGKTVDSRGNRVFVLTLQAREQHIRRNKATSNICSNQGLMALWVTIYMSLNGPEGLREINERGRDAAHWLRDELTATGRMRPLFATSPFLNEFAMNTEGLDLDRLFERCAERGILPGVVIGKDQLLIAVTERQSRAQLEEFVELVKTAEK